MKNIIAVEAGTQMSPITSNITYLPIAVKDGSSFTVKNNGTAAAPCRISITTINDIMALKITGLSEDPITVQSVLAKSNLIIDGINKNITINGKQAFDQYDAWEFPRLLPGTNQVTITNANDMVINIEYQPRYI